MPRRPDALTAASEGACQWWGWLLAVREWSKGLAPERRTATPCRWSVDFELPEADLYPRQGRHKRQTSGYVRKYGQLLTPRYGDPEGIPAHPGGGVFGHPHATDRGDLELRHSGRDRRVVAHIPTKCHQRRVTERAPLQGVHRVVISR